MEFLWEGFAAVTWQQCVMYLVGIALIYLAIRKQYEPSLLLPMGFVAMLLGFDLKDAASIGMIGAADGPTSILVSQILHSQCHPV